jgi:hypothetical protein
MPYINGEANVAAPLNEQPRQGAMGVSLLLTVLMPSYGAIFPFIEEKIFSSVRSGKILSLIGIFIMKRKFTQPTAHNRRAKRR